MSAPDALDSAQLVDGVECRPIPGLEGLYLASKDGRIYSVRRRIWLAPALSRGYQVVSIAIRGRTKVRKIHRLVALAWIPNPLGLPTVNHDNTDKTDNRVDNLEWASHSHQQSHAFQHGLRNTTPAMRAASSRNITGVAIKQRKLGAEDVALAKQTALSCVAAGRLLGVSGSAVHAIRKGKTYVS